MEKAMAHHSSTFAWKIPWTEEPGRLQSMGSLRVRHDWATSLSLFTFMHWRRRWQPTPVFLPGESQGWGSLVGCRLWGRRVGHDWSNLAAAALGHGLGFTKTVCVCVCVCTRICTHAHIICGCVFGGEEDTGMQTVMTVRSALFTQWESLFFFFNIMYSLS